MCTGDIAVGVYVVVVAVALLNCMSTQEVAYTL